MHAATTRPDEKKIKFDTSHEQLRLFQRGNVEVLGSQDFLEFLPEHIFSLFNSDNIPTALSLLTLIGAETINPQTENRERSLTALSIIAQKVIDSGNDELLEIITKLFTNWLKNEKEYIVGFEFLSIQLCKLVQKMLDQGLWYQSEDIIVALHNIRKGRIEKNRILTSVIAKIHKSLAQRNLLEQLTNSYLDQKQDKSTIAGTILTLFGGNATPYLLEQLSSCEVKARRLKLLKLIPAAGNEVLPAIVEKLHDHSPWYFIRNLIFLISRAGNESHYSLLQPFLHHSDIRVQDEIISFIQKTQGEKQVNRLLSLFEQCDDTLKPRLVSILGSINSPESENGLNNILEKCNTLSPETRNDIIRQLCQQFPEDNEFIFSTKLLSLMEDETRATDTEEKKSNDPIPVTNTSEISVYHTLISSANTLDIDFFTNLGIAATSVDWFNEVVSNPSIPAYLRNHLTLRNDFYSSLPFQEFSALCSRLKYLQVPPGTILASYGDIHSTLFMVDNGLLSLRFPKNEKDIHVRELQKGDVIGHDIFMSGNEWPVTLETTCETELLTFDQEHLLILQPIFPDLCKKIISYSKINDYVSDLIQSESTTQFAKSTLPSIPFTGDMGDIIAEVDLMDIQPYGLCFSLQLPMGIGYGLFVDKDLEIRFENPIHERESFEAEITSLKYIEKEERTLYIFARFKLPQNISQHTCTKIILL